MDASDAELVARLRRADVQALEEAYRRHAERVFGFLLRLTNERAFG
ncbi:MAG: hypothetical protein QM756_34255 [Polyangiaceae bacterium]